jgi:uncharacterized protein YraI
MFRHGLFVLVSVLIAFSAFAGGHAATMPGTVPGKPTAASPALPITFPAVGKVLKSANVRSGPGTNYAVISSARPGQRLNLLGCNADCSWYQLADDCWIAAFLIEVEQPTAIGAQVTTVQLPPADARLPTVVVSIPITVSDVTSQTTRCPQTMAALNVYAGPGTFYLTAGTLPAGECISVIGRNAIGDWFLLSQGFWVLAAAVLYAEPIETMPIADRFFTATPEPTPTLRPTETPTPEPTEVVYAEITTVGEWMNASQEQKAATAFIWTVRLGDAGLVTTDLVRFAAALLVCVDNTLATTADILGPDYAVQEIAAGCASTLND